VKLARRLALLLFLGIAAVMGVDAVLRVSEETSLFDADAARDHRVLAEALGPALSRAWAAGDPRVALDLLRRVNARHGELEARWVWLDSDRVVRARLGPRPRAGVPIQLAVSDASGTPSLVTYYLASGPSGRTGVIELREPSRFRRQYVVASLLRTGATTAAIAVVCGAMAIVLGILLVGRPVEALVRQSRRIGSGELGARSEILRKDELGDLAREMNLMAARLATADHKLRQETRERMQALEQLRHADRLATVGRLAAGLAHELGTPLNVVSGRAKLIQKSPDATEAIRENARIVGDQTQRVAQIIRQLLDFARTGEARKLPANLGQVLREVVTLLEPMAKKRSVNLELSVPDQLPEVLIDRAQIQQVASNLIVNALQATERAGTVRVSAEPVRLDSQDDGSPTPSHVRLVVADNGTGMPPEVRARVFEPFFTTRPVGEGTGLGLSVAWGIVNEHGGHIDLDTSEGEGTRFFVYLPLLSPSERETDVREANS
jgi:two-component system, NtrC family, sensor kinase